ncbi:MAG: YeaH/YhbH family protein [Roseibium sp.]|uniref:YeaH/YhbH family protein n=1 Tax=Roseibium sp. TaxID=1936156 RepID=UPI001B070D25|nr:YeaH/YhbH family protein [Roseibium sp.]MBO6893998.1 YeaH/YhbH family protein [Roseibium sp.]MBO6930761.1 YeaH/YhbH family protein [Roseibium sp.]
MAHFVDRRLNPKDKSLSNRRRFLKRVRSQIKKAVEDAVRERSITDVDRAKDVSVPTDGVAEHTFRQASDEGRRERVFTGNKSFQTGDKIQKPPSGGGSGAGREGSPDGEGEDDFLFALTREEFLDFFFDDLELPDLVKQSLKEITRTHPRRAGYSTTGAPANISVTRTMRNAFGRRIGLRRPRDRDMEAVRERISALEQVSVPTREQQAELTTLRSKYEEMKRRRKVIAYIDPLDVRYNNFEQQPEPNANAVMFCLMDVSASMGEREKDLAKRFFMLLHLFLNRRYEKTDIVFIRHTHDASEVDEETFFYSPQTGGTVVSTALVMMKQVIEERYPPSEWNIYAAQASDGENFGGDSSKCATLLNEDLMRVCQYFAYVEIVGEDEAQLINSEASGMELWQSYRQVGEVWPNFAQKRVSKIADIYPVFRELFARDNAGKSHG